MPKKFVVILIKADAATTIDRLSVGARITLESPPAIWYCVTNNVDLVLDLFHLPRIIELGCFQVVIKQQSWWRNG